jgi:hypothetical protein
VSPLFGSAWHRAHREAHLTAFPDVDLVTETNLAQFILDAERKESSEGA